MTWLRRFYRRAEWHALSVVTISALSAAAAVAPSRATAQEAAFNADFGRSGLFVRNRETSVADRPQPEFDPVPIRLNSFALTASVAATAGYTDNVFATDTNTVDDAFFRANGSADLVSDWSRNQMRVFARATATRFAKTSVDNVDLFGVGGTGRLDVTSDAAIQAGASYSRNVISRTSSRSPTSSTGLVTYHEARGFVGGTYGARNLRLVGQVDYRQQRYSTISQTSAATGEDFNDRNLLNGSLRAEYAISAPISIFVQGSANTRDYLTQSLNRPRRNSSGIEATAGSSFEVGTLMRGEVSLGYLQQRFDSPAYLDYDGLAYHAQLEYFPTRLISVTANADRTVEDSSLIGVGAFISNTYAARIDYEFRRNVIITPQIGIGRDKYRGLDLAYDRTFARLAARWTLSRAVLLDLAYNLEARQAHGTVPAREFTVNYARLGATYRF